MSTFVSALSGILILLRCPSMFQQVQDDFPFTAQAWLHFSIYRSQGGFNAPSLSFERMTQLLPQNNSTPATECFSFESCSVNYSQVIGCLSFLIIYLKRLSIQNLPCTTVALVSNHWLPVKTRGTAKGFLKDSFHSQCSSMCWIPAISCYLHFHDTSFPEHKVTCKAWICSCTS